MSSEHNFKLVEMGERHLNQVVEIARANGLSYWSLEDYRKEISRKDSYCLVSINEQNQTNGFIVARLIIMENCAEIYNIAVHDTAKLQGIGNSMLSSLIKHCKDKQLQKIHLEVRESNQAAINFYSKINFKVVGFRKNFYSHPIENAVLMTRNLDDADL